MRLETWQNTNYKSSAKSTKPNHMRQGRALLSMQALVSAIILSQQLEVLNQYF